MPIDAIDVASGIVGATVAAGASHEYTSRRKALEDQGQNDMTQHDCEQ